MSVIAPAGALLPDDYEAALTGGFALMASNPAPGTPESAIVERIFALGPEEAASTARFMDAMKVSAKAWADAQ